MPHIELKLLHSVALIEKKVVCFSHPFNVSGLFHIIVLTFQTSCFIQLNILKKIYFYSKFIKIIIF